MSRFIFIALLFTTLPAKAAWQKQNFFPNQNNVLISMNAFDAQTLCAVGAMDQMGNTSPISLCTHDGGANWQQGQIGSGGMDIAIPMAVRMLSAQQGFIAATGMKPKMYKTTNGGMSWAAVTLPVSGIGKSLMDLSFLDTTRGLSAGGEDLVLYTTDGGGQWQQGQATAPSGAYMNGVSLADTQTAYIVGGDQGETDEETGQTIRPPGKGFVMKSTDGGISFSILKQDLSYCLMRVFFINARKGWAIGFKENSGVIVSTGDGGQNWQEQQIPSHPQGYISPMAIQFLTESIGWIAGAAVVENTDTLFGTVLKTDNGGQTWIRDESYEAGLSLFEKGSGLLALGFADCNTGWVAGQNHLIMKLFPPSDGKQPTESLPT